jgi:hypothetical protein
MPDGLDGIMLLRELLRILLAWDLLAIEERLNALKGLGMRIAFEVSYRSITYALDHSDCSLLEGCIARSV